jgi:hypothetical protein
MAIPAYVPKLIAVWEAEHRIARELEGVAEALPLPGAAAAQVGVQAARARASRVLARIQALSGRSLFPVIRDNDNPDLGASVKEVLALMLGVVKAYKALEFEARKAGDTVSAWILMTNLGDYDAETLRLRDIDKSLEMSKMAPQGEANADQAGDVAAQSEGTSV